jgi:Sulfatase
VRVPTPAVAAIRALTLVFFGATALYAIVAFSPFAYHQFIRPRLLPWLVRSVTFYHALFLGIFSASLLTLVADIERTRTRALALGYMAVWGVVALGLFVRPVLAEVGPDRSSLVVAVVALLPPIWLAVIDHLACWTTVFPGVNTRAVEEDDQAPAFSRLFAASALTATYVWLLYASLAVVRQWQAPQGGLSLAGLGRSLLLHAGMFTAVGWLLVAAAAIGRYRRDARAAEFVLVLLILAGWIDALLERLLLPSLGVGGLAMAFVAAAFAIAMAAGWSGIALRLAAADGPATSGFDVFVRPAAPRRSRRALIASLLVLPGIAYLAVATSEQMDWGFLLQKGGVLAVWFLAFAALVRLARNARQPSLRAAIVGSLLIIAGFEGTRVLEGRASPPDRIRRVSSLERYAALDASFRTLDDALAERPQTSRAYYQFLGANSNVAPSVPIAPRPIAFAREIVRPPAPPHVFLFVLDSLRPDYLSPYNAAVNFTPQFQAFANDSVVFRRAFTRYGGTGLAVPSIWSGTMLPHRQYVLPFEPMNTLLTLLRATGYQVMASLDTVMLQLLGRPPGLVELGASGWAARDDGCQVLADLTRVLAETGSGPVFAYSLPQNLHISYVQGHPILDEPHAGFYAPLAARVRMLDACFGEFVRQLRQRGLYDDSIVIVTSDHGDSLGEGGRWGHGLAGFPEIFRVPLIVHIPQRFARAWTADADGVSFTTDIVPSLYRLLGQDIALRGPIFGMPLFHARGALPSPERRRDAFLLASGYGPVYGLLQRNGELLYVVDAVNARDYEFDLSGGALHETRVPVTSAERTASQQMIREQIEQIAAYFNFDPQPSQ